jgi:hypothetical protein
MPKNDVMFLIMTVATKNGSGSTTDYYGAATRWRCHRRTGPAARIAPRGKHPQRQARPMTVPRIGNVIDAQTNWKRKFEDPISLLSGKKLVTLRDAADYITSLTKNESDLPGWQAAIEALMLVSRSGPTMMARIGVMKALNRHVERVFNPDRKDTHWGKRKLKRDE